MSEEGITQERMDKLIQWAKEHQLPKTKIGNNYYYKFPGEGPMVKINEDPCK
ncbi:MAG: hypothetical protein ACWGNI_00270 [Desulfobacterales bacterium]